MMEVVQMIDEPGFMCGSAALVIQNARKRG